MEINLTVNTYKIKYKVEKDDDGGELITPDVNSINKSEDLVDTKSYEYDSTEHNIQLKIKEHAEQVKKYNRIQLTTAKGKESGLYQIVTTKDKVQSN